IAASYFINNYLIPIYLFNGKFLKFIYLLIYTIVISFWINFISLILILVYTIFYLPQIIVPQYSDIILLFSGTYLIILLSAIFHFIKESYGRLIEKNNVEKQKRLTEIKLKEARLKLLQGQINPHFLFNMLNNLYGLVKESADESREVIVKLSDLLDYMLYECDKPKVSLKREIEFIQDYIELERIRHDEHFNVKTSFPDLKEDILIAPLILFPFVENAFKHGFHNPEKSKLNMEISVNPKSLLFFIENSITKNTEDQYLKQEGKGIGLRNIQERLELIYKDKYQLDIFNKENTFVVKLEINLE
ncbi:MAG: histidine kinase, partial [Bacteroidales bacterium]